MNSTTRIPLAVGDPDSRKKKPATFSRFILPFAYQPQFATRSREQTESAVWRPIQLDGSDLDQARSRFHYFTIETADVLYRRASWWQLKLSTDVAARMSFDCPRRSGGTYRVAIQPPRLALFEWRNAYQRLKEHHADIGDLLATGFLLVDVYFPEQTTPPEFDDLLDFNEKFRYWRQPYVGHSDTDQNVGGRWYLHQLGQKPARPKKGDDTLVATAKGCKEADRSRELYTRWWLDWLECPLETERRLHLFPSSFADDASTWLERPESAASEGWAVYADHRAFVWTCAQVPDGASFLARADGENKADLTTLGRWIKLLNVDSAGGSPGERTAFERDWSAGRTYKRWASFGTLYGFSYHSGAMISEPRREPPFWLHFRYTYADQVLLLLYLRVTTFRFSRALSRQAADARDAVTGFSDRQSQLLWHARFQRLQHDFVLFSDLYKFPLVSNQQQAVELYGLAREALDVEDLCREIESEVAATDGLFDNLVARNLNLIAHVGLALALATGLFGMNLVIDRLPWVDAEASGFEPRKLTVEVAWFVGISLVTVFLFMRQSVSFQALDQRVRRWVTRSYSRLRQWVVEGF